MTSHELAKLLLEGPNLPIFVQDEYILPIEAAPRTEKVFEYTSKGFGYGIVGKGPLTPREKAATEALVLVGA